MWQLVRRLPLFSGCEVEFAPAPGFAAETTHREGIGKFIRENARSAVAGIESGGERFMPTSTFSQDCLLFGAERV